MLKALSSVPFLALLAVLIFRGMSAPPSREQVAQASNPAAPKTTPPATSPQMKLARRSFEDGVKAITNARAIALFNRAQTEGDAIAWIDGYCRTVAGDVGYLRQSLGTVTGEAGQFGEFLNRSAELAACSLAHHWLMNGGIPTDVASVNPGPILDLYREAYGNDPTPQG